MPNENQYSRMPLDQLLLEAEQIGRDDDLVRTLTNKLKLAMSGQRLRASAARLEDELEGLV